jgi:glycosyltransferase involved in cell wall biosynthesis
VVLVDDGSTDDTADVARHFPRVTYIRQENSGPAEARNRGLAEVTTPWVAFLDADDRLRPQFIARTTRAVRWAPMRRKIAVVYSPAIRIGTHSGVQPVDVFDRHMLGAFNYIGICALVRVDAIRQAGCFAPELSRLGLEDWDLWLSLIERGWRGKMLPEPLWEYRGHSGPRMNATAHASDAAVRVVTNRHPWRAENVGPSPPARVIRKARRTMGRLRAERALRRIGQSGDQPSIGTDI